MKFKMAGVVQQRAILFREDRESPVGKVEFDAAYVPVPVVGGIPILQKLNHEEFAAQFQDSK